MKTSGLTFLFDSSRRSSPTQTLFQSNINAGKKTHNPHLVVFLYLDPKKKIFSDKKQWQNLDMILFLVMEQVVGVGGLCASWPDVRLPCLLVCSPCSPLRSAALTARRAGRGGMIDSSRRAPSLPITGPKEGGGTKRCARRGRARSGSGQWKARCGRSGEGQATHGAVRMQCDLLPVWCCCSTQRG